MQAWNCRLRFCRSSCRSHHNLLYGEDNLKPIGRMRCDSTGSPFLCAGIKSGNSLMPRCTSSFALSAYSSGMVLCIISTSPILPLLSISSCAITFPSVCASFYFSGYFRLDTKNSFKASIPPGNSASLSTDEYGSHETLQLVN